MFLLYSSFKIQILGYKKTNLLDSTNPVRTWTNETKYVLAILWVYSKYILLLIGKQMCLRNLIWKSNELKVTWKWYFVKIKLLSLKYVFWWVEYE